MNEAIANAIADSAARELSIQLLRSVPGMPPVSQAIHILGIAVIAASAMLLDLRVLGVAVRSQELDEMVRRLLPWTWWALLVNLLTGMPFVLARPYRYFMNPVFGWKIAFLVPALALTLAFHLLGRKPEFWQRSGARLAARFGAGLSLLLWIGVMMAGRWIAYSDYLFWDG
jgi:hypothetical protein